MRTALFASAFAVVTWLALGAAPAEAQTEDKAASCQSCAQSGSCPHCVEGKNCPHCNEGKDCAHCKGDRTACGHCGKSKSHHGNWGAHKWEYKCVRPNKKPEAMSKQFSGLGEQGWRLMEADGGIWCFSRMRQTK